MQCFSCGVELPPEAKFCLQCGAAHVTKETRREGRSTNLDPRAYTPKHLADKILQSKSALEGERKQVTVLFADIQGSMQLATQLELEQWHQLLERYIAILMGAVYRFEGTVNHYTGDDVMRLGVPITVGRLRNPFPSTALRHKLQGSGIPDVAKDSRP